MSKTGTSSSATPPSGAVALLRQILDRLALQAGDGARPHTTSQSNDSGAVGKADSKADSEADSEAVGTDGGDHQQASASKGPQKGPQASLGAVLSQLDERAYGMLLLLLALPCCLPFVYILPQIVALPMLALAAQLALGRASPWLPARLKNRQFAINDFERVLARAAKYIGWFERFARPRLGFVTGKTGARIVGAILLIPCASILLPLPSTNTAPGIGVAITAVGLIERDGLLVILGLVMGLAWVVLLVFLGFEASQIIKGWVLGG